MEKVDINRSLSLTEQTRKEITRHYLIAAICAVLFVGACMLQLSMRETMFLRWIGFLATPITIIVCFSQLMFISEKKVLLVHIASKEGANH